MRTPSISGILGYFFGASGEIVVDMEASGGKNRRGRPVCPIDRAGARAFSSLLPGSSNRSWLGLHFKSDGVAGADGVMICPMGRLAILAWAFLGLLLLSADAQPQRRVALVIGNGSYAEAGTLANPVNDALDIADKLRSIGFEVIEGNDLGKRELERSRRDPTASRAI
ncbi:caspase family protein [Mesorhizobium sp. M7A.F.Ca.US.011.01.1.1]|uniref:caspase family protein n=1 Tax=Mesorhizobium sp. M7A.F.Ca.US.011.01.1.1 TaxID=2496741 RepID=UPI001FDF159F|nr:caspase family protein [Mesorhizobium sp. M7A.F.Ca.US.011.01.1.1]